MKVGLLLVVSIAIFATVVVIISPTLLPKFYGGLAKYEPKAGGDTFYSLPQEESTQGFKILHSSQEAGEGRSLFYDGKNFFDGIGSGRRIVGSTSRSFVDYVVGALSAEGFIAIEESSDFYIRLQNPQSGKLIEDRFRLVAQGTEDYSSTALLVEDPRSEPRLELIGFLSGLGKQELDRLIRPGDAVALEFVSKDGTGLNDNYFYPIVDNLVIRRFGGLEKVKAEIGK